MERKTYAVVSPVNPRARVWLNGSFSLPGKNEVYILDKAFSVKKTHKGIASKITKEQEDNVFWEHFSAQNPTLMLTYETEAEKKILKAAVDGWFRIHPMIVDKGNPMNEKTLPNFNPNQKGQPIYMLEVVEELIEQQSSSDEEKVKVYDTWTKLSAARKNDVCFYFSVDPRKYNEPELNVRMVGLATGLLMGTNRGTFLSIFGKEAEVNPTRLELTILTQKALEYSRELPEENAILVEKGGKLFWGGDLVANNVEEFALYLETNEPVVNSIKKSIASIDSKNKALKS